MNRHSEVLLVKKYVTLTISHTALYHHDNDDDDEEQSREVCHVNTALIGQKMISQTASVQSGVTFNTFCSHRV